LILLRHPPLRRHLYLQTCFPPPFFPFYKPKLWTTHIPPALFPLHSCSTTLPSNRRCHKNYPLPALLESILSRARFNSLLSLSACSFPLCSPRSTLEELEQCFRFTALILTSSPFFFTYSIMGKQIPSWCFTTFARYK